MLENITSKMRQLWIFYSCILIINIGQAQNKYIDEFCNNYWEFDSLDANFILEWQKSNQPISSLQFQKLNKYEKSSYEIFETWYSCNSSNFYKTSDRREIDSCKGQFYIIQDTLKYIVTSKDSSELMDGEGVFRRMKKRDLIYARKHGLPIPDFSPRLNISNKDLQLRGLYAKTFIDFMNDSICNWNDSPWRNEMFSRARHFGEYTNVSIRHWGNGWDYYPFVQSITLNEDCSWAFLVWQNWSSAGFSLLEKKRDEWIITKAGILATQ